MEFVFTTCIHTGFAVVIGLELLIQIWIHNSVVIGTVSSAFVRATRALRERAADTMKMRNAKRTNLGAIVVSEKVRNSIDKAIDG